MDKLYKEKFSRFREKITPEKLLKTVAVKSVFVFAGLLCSLARMPMGALPLGFSLLGASDKNALFVYIGLIGGSLSFAAEEPRRAVLLAGAYSAQLLLRVLLLFSVNIKGEKNKSSSFTPSELWQRLFCEKPLFRIILATVTALAYSFFFTVSEGFLYYDLLGLLIAVLSAPLATYLFYCFFYKSDAMHHLGLLALLSAGALGAMSINIYGVSLAVLGGLFAVLYMTQKKGLALGIFTALATGLVYSPSLSPAFIFASLAMWIFGRVSVSLVCFVAFITACAWGFYVSGLDVLSGFLGGVLGASLLYPAVSKFCSFKKSERTAKEKQGGERTSCRVLPASMLDGIQLRELNERMAYTREALKRASDIIKPHTSSLSHKDSLRTVCTHAFETSCTGCPQFSDCKSQRLQKKAVEAALVRLNAGEPLEHWRLSSSLLHKCERLHDIIDEINYNSYKLSELPPDDGREENDFCALDGKDISAILSMSMENDSDEYIINRELSEKLCKALEKASLGCLGAAVFGNRCKKAYIQAKPQILSTRKELILSVLEASLPFALDEASAKIFNTGTKEALLVCEKKAFSADTAIRQRKAEGEQFFCGDSCTSFENSDSRHFTLISDGMGSGENASYVSRLCCSFLEAMLQRGKMDCRLIDTLGNALRRCTLSSAGECSATLDLLELDLVSGEARLFKSGASPSFLLRNGNTLKLRAHNMPIGILPQCECKQFSIPVENGDIILLVSDGVLDGSEECPWLYEIFGTQGITAEELAQRVLDYASEFSHDDITVIAVQIKAVQ